MSTTLGRSPERVTVNLVRTDPFRCVLTRYDAPASNASRAAVDWDDPPTLEFPDADVADWVATIAANEATFDVPAASVDALIATGMKRCLLTVGTITWATGSWTVRG